MYLCIQFNSKLLEIPCGVLQFCRIMTLLQILSGNPGASPRLTHSHTLRQILVLKQAKNFSLKFIFAWGLNSKPLLFYLFLPHFIFDALRFNHKSMRIYSSLLFQPPVFVFCHNNLLKVERCNFDSVFFTLKQNLFDRVLCMHAFLLLLDSVSCHLSVEKMG